VVKVIVSSFHMPERERFESSMWVEKPIIDS
jgi:hypothetical protein